VDFATICLEALRETEVKTKICIVQLDTETEPEARYIHEPEARYIHEDKGDKNDGDTIRVILVCCQ
jgi:hypothetical protein